MFGFTETKAAAWENVKAAAEYFKDLYHNGLVDNLVSTLVLILAVVVLRWVAARAIRRIDHLPNEVRRRWLVQLRNGALLIVLIGVIVIWAEALRMIAFSMFAVAVALVIATKELIQCLSGAVLKSTSRSCAIGDRIEIAGVRGDVIDQNALTTTVMEIGPDDLTQQLTGRAIVLPNSVFLGKPLINEFFTEEYVLHIFKVPARLDENWLTAEQNLLASAQAECSSFLDDARNHFERLCKKEGLVNLSVEPRVSVTVNKPDEIELVVRVAVPARKKGRIEQAILRRYLTLVVGRKTKENESSRSPTEEMPS